jgi:hypothetical protein
MFFKPFEVSKGSSVYLKYVDSKKIYSERCERHLIFVKVANPYTYENIEFLLASDSVLPEGLKVGDDVDVTISCDGKYTSLTLVPVNK